MLVLSQYAESRLAADLVTGSSGGSGYLLKDRVAQVGEVLDAVDRVGAGGTAVDPEVVRRLLPRRDPGPLETLTERETNVLKLMA